MRAAVFHDAKDVRVEDVAEPTAVGAREVRLKPFWCGICGTDLHEYAVGPIVIPTRPHPLNGSAAPQILGHEFSGEVLEVGAEVTTVRVGDRVSVMPLLFCGVCYFCRRGLNHLCTSMACVGLSDAWGGIAAQCVVPESKVAKLPDTMSDIQGALVEPTAVAAYGVDSAGVRPGDTVLVTGLGPIGALASLYASALGATVFMSEINPRRQELARSLDVGELLDPRSTDVVAEIRDRTGGIGVDAVIECSGNEIALQTALASVRAAGTVAQTGLHTKPAAIDPMVLSERDITLRGTWCYPVTDWPRIIDLIGRGRLDVEKVVSARIDMTDIVEKGFETLLSPTGDQIKVLVRAE
ncbi:2,3-butanediol dehydrogenase [Microbacterium invictum]|uniref:2,3-butanediol dehydrogenase n=1 Tax=Microbacterium invictum TaxID=515415 RepID=A0ABZ0VB64_9MICO|nr:2,3-butanediol dehydrogenase [Microbacterium invictum]WQB69916.1 2,3-butanediol dehydrogenase [Microbacterium invictum]